METQDIIKQFGKSDKDTGSSEVQIALLSKRINLISNHLKNNKGDKHSQRGLLLLVEQRKKMLRYLKNKNKDSYTKTIAALGLRH